MVSETHDSVKLKASLSSDELCLLCLYKRSGLSDKIISPHGSSIILILKKSSSILTVKDLKIFSGVVVDINILATSSLLFFVVAPF